MTLTNIANTRLERLFSVADEWPNVDDTFKEYLKNNISNPEKAIKILATCKCCDRHQIKKPLILEKYINSESSERSHEPECYCKCRHLSRYICRVFVQ